MKEHLCDTMREMRRIPLGYGCAINEIYYHEGQWVASSESGEYGTAIRFCPFCGEKLGVNVERVYDRSVSTAKA